MVLKRLLMPALILGIVFGLSNMAYATVNCALSVPQGATGVATATGHTEPIASGSTGVPSTPGGGQLRVTCTDDGSATATGVGVLTFNLGVPITNSTSHPAGAAIRVVGVGTGAFQTTGAAPNVGISSVSNSGGQIVVGLGTPVTTSSANPTAGIPWTAGQVGAFDLFGVLVSTNGRTTGVDATLAISGGSGYTVTDPTKPAVTAVLPGLKDPTIPTGTLPAAAVIGTTTTGGTASVSSNGTVTAGHFTLRIEEGYPSMFKDSTQFNGGAVFPVSAGSDTQVNIVFSNIPVGFSVGGCGVVMTDTTGTVLAGGTAPSLSSTAATSGAPVLTVNFNSPVNLVETDVLWVTCSAVSTSTATLPLPSTSITAQVTLGPTGAALASTGTPTLTGLTTGQIPRYQQALIPATALTVVNFPPAATTLLIPFAAVGTGFNTGIAIANTSASIVGSSQDGTISFTLYKNDGTTKTYVTTTGSPGGGLTGAGVLAASRTYAVNVSELLSAAAFGTDFLGHIVITTNFVGAHAAATIYVTSTGAATLSTPVLIVAGTGLGQ